MIQPVSHTPGADASGSVGRRVLLTGAGGFIGRQCLPLLASRFDEIHAVTRGSSPGERSSASLHDASSAARTHWHQVDLLDAARTAALIEEVRPTHLLHLAWNTEPGVYLNSATNLDWLASSLTLIRRFYELGGQRLVTAGTCFEYDASLGVCRESDGACRPSTLYGQCKLALGQVARSFAVQLQHSHAHSRIFFVYGPHEHPRRFVPSIMRSLLAGQAAPCSHGRQLRDYLHVYDVAAAHVQLLTSEVVGIVNVGSGVAPSISEIATRIGSLTGRRELLRFGAVATPENDPPRIVADVARLHAELGFVPRFDLRSGLAHTLDHHTQFESLSCPRFDPAPFATPALR